MSETFSKVEVITGFARRWRFTTEQKLLVVNETLQPGLSITDVRPSLGAGAWLVGLQWRCLGPDSDIGEARHRIIEARKPGVMASRRKRPPPCDRGR